MTFPFMRLAMQNDLAVRVEYDAHKQVAIRFLDAVKFNPDAAWAFVSRICSSKLNLDEIREFAVADLQHVKFAAYANTSKNWETHSMYVTDKKKKVRKLLHLRMVKEPDGKWKIFGVEQEECSLR